MTATASATPIRAGHIQTLRFFSSHRPPPLLLCWKSAEIIILFATYVEAAMRAARWIYMTISLPSC